MTPLVEPARVGAAQAATTEGVRFLSMSPGFPLRAPSELESILDALQVEGRALEPLSLLGLADYLESIDATRRVIASAAEPYPVLKRLVEAIASFGSEIAAVRRKIEPSGEVADNASAALASIRERLRRQKSKLRSTLESFLRERETSKYLQEQVVTDRNGRYVLMVRAEHRGSIPGIVHGSSASGQSLFLEPLGTVEINNDIVELEEQEAAEVHRILLELTVAFRSRPDDLERTFDMAAELDTIQARARFSQLTGGIEPLVAPDGAFELRGARHPLLMSAVRAREDVEDEAPATRTHTEPVAVDVLMTPPTRVLIIAGPNTGGKTVALKTAGLFAAMAQAGLHLPADKGTRLPGFQERLRRHRRRAVDLGEPQHVFRARHQRGGDGSRPGAAGARAARRGGCRHRPRRGRCARHRRHRSLPPPRRAPGGHHALRRAQDLRVHDRGRGERGVRLRPGHVRADLSPRLRITRPQPRHRDRIAAGHAARRHRGGARQPLGPRSAAPGSPRSRGS